MLSLQKKMLISVVFLFLTTFAYAQDDQWLVTAGGGDLNSDKGNIPETKMATVGYQSDFWGAVKERASLGGWIDNSGGGRSSSFFGSGQLGFEVNNNGWLAGVYTGPGLITNTDLVLGGHLQFFSELNLGMQDRMSNYMGLFFRHISSAGLATPNDGRNVAGLQIKF